MEKISSFLLEEILTFLEFPEIIESMRLNKKFKTLIKTARFWNSLFTVPRISSFHSGPYFDYKICPKMIRNLNLLNCDLKSYEELIETHSLLRNPEKLEIQSITCPSPNFENKSKNFEHYSQFDFISVFSDSKDSQTELLIELSESSFIFSFSFKVFRALYNLSILFAPKQVKILIGETSGSFFWESETYKVDLSENQNTILVLPTLLKGRFLKCVFLRHQSKHPEQEVWKTIIQFIEIVGRPVSFEGEGIVSIIKSQQFSRVFAKTVLLSPFYYERVHFCGELQSFFQVLPNCNTDIEAYFYYRFSSVFDFAPRNLGNYEIVGNYFFDQNEYLAAEKVFFCIRDLRSLSRCELVKRDFRKLIFCTRENDSRYPDLEFLRTQALKIGGVELEAELMRQLS